ncbi:MAG: hypothetical protein JWO62_3480 [Acidimicrobiaceae bacterium]|nr:hypothetical protein [Acidimicrobiaceae bacterium]
MTTRVGASRPSQVLGGRRLALVLATLLLLIVLLPPLGVLARRYEVVEAAQFAVLAVVIPALLVLGAPWLGLGGGSATEISESLEMHRSWSNSMRSSAQKRLRHRSPFRSAGYLALYGGVTIAWRVPPAVDALAKMPWLSLLEAVTLVVCGVLLWLELVPSVPFVPRSAYPMRIAVAALAMWITWALGYVLGLSHVAWFPDYHHTAGSGLSLSADQQLAAGVLWVVPAVAFLPLIFVSLMTWLKDSEDPDDEMRQLLRAERRRSWWNPPATPHGPQRGDGGRGGSGAGPPEPRADGGDG